MQECLFCKIAAGEIPSDRVYETDRVLAFRDIDPQAPFHAVIIPKRHIASAAEVTPENSGVVAEIFEAVSAIAGREGFDGGFRVVSNCGPDAGQSVKHLHFHMLAGRKFAWPPG